MKVNFKKALSLVLCLVLCAGLCLSVFAANENNANGVTISASLDKTEINFSETDNQTVTLTVTMSKPSALDSVEFKINTPDGFTVSQPVVSQYGASGIGDWNSSRQSYAWMASGDDVTGVTELLKADITVPAGTVAGNYTINVGSIKLSSGFTYWETAATASATLTVAGSEPAPTADYTLTLTSDKSEVKVDETFTVTATVSGAAFNGIQGTVSYDTTVFQLVSSTGIGVKTAGSAELEQVFATKADGTAVAELTFKALKATETASQITATATIGDYESFKNDCVNAAVVPVSVKVNPKTFTVSIASTVYGTIEVSPASAAQGQIVTVTNVTPDDGYELEKLVYVVEGSDVENDITEAKSFTMPAANVTVKATFKASANPWTTETKSDYVSGATLVIVKGENANGYTYDGKTMYKIADDTFAYLVEGTADSAKVAESTSACTDLTSFAVMDVNGTGKVDFNDAGAAFGCYNLAYDIATNMAMYLRADVNGDYVVNANDVAAILG